MADLFLSPVLELILDRLASHVLDKFVDMCDLELNIQKLKQTLPMVQGLLADAEYQRATNITVRIWVTKLEAAALDAEELLLRFTGTGVLFSAQNARKVREVLHALEKIVDEGLGLNLKKGSEAVSVWDGRETSSFVIESEVYGIHEDKEKIVEILLSCEASHVGRVSCITIVGVGGLGKTTLAQLAYNDQRVTQHFDVKVWVFVSHHFDVKNILMTVIESLTNDKCRHSKMDALHSRVWHLLQKKRYLIVLDEVWTEDQDDWDKLKPLLRGGIDGGEEENHPNLLPIGQQIVKKCGGLALAAKTLGSSMRFKREVGEWLFVRDSELWNFDDCGTGILPALKLSFYQLPLQLKRCFALCSIFPRNYELKKDKIIHLWIAEGIIQFRNGKLLEDIGNEYFNDLLSMSFFQEIKPYDNDVVNRYKIHDVMYDLVQSVAGSYYTILRPHPRPHLPTPCSYRQVRHASVVSDFTSSMIPEELYEAKCLRTLLLFSGDNLGELPSKLYSKCKYLVMLDLSGSGLVCLDESIGLLSSLSFLGLSHTPIKVLPKVIEGLPLQTLNLFNCYNLLSLPDLRKMKNLTHLNNAGCEALTGIVSRPGDRMDPWIFNYNGENMFLPESLSSKLRMLPLCVIGGNVDTWFLGRLNLRGSLKITQLENLHCEDDAKCAELMRKEDIESLGLYWGNNVHDPDDYLEEELAITGFQKRRRVGHSPGQSQWTELDASLGEEVLKHLQPPRNLKRLLIRGYPGIRFPHWSLPYLNAVTLIECRKSEHLPTLGISNFLTRIGREFYSEGQTSPFPSLKELVLVDFPNLEEWSNAHWGNAFPNLSKLIVKACPKLSLVPQILSIQHLQLQDCNTNLVHSFRNLNSLKTLAIEKVSDLFYFPGEFPANNPLLRSLDIKSCPQLRSLPHGLGNLSALNSLTIRWCEDLSFLPQSLQNLSSMESLEIGDCHGLMSLPESGTRGLSSLRNLSIENCHNLSSLSMGFQYLTSLENLTIMYCPSIGVFPRGVEHLSALRSLTVICCPQFMYLPEGLQYLKSLHTLEIRSCSGLKDLPEWVEKLVSMRSLSISDCENVKFLPEGIKRLTALQHLSIQDCPLLEERCRGQDGEDWPKIVHVPYKHIGSAKQTNPSEAGSSSLA
ncbi:hypothetical protein UlMin_042703 [Ulmus minor]